MPSPKTAHVTAITIVLLALLSPSVTRAADMRVVIEGLRSTHGTVWVALFNNASGFDSDTRFAGSFRRAKAGRIIVAFPELPQGTYAVSAFHDENGSGDLDTNFLGIPSEGYGFSNEAKGFAGPPSFDAASVVLEDKNLTVTLKLTY